MLRQMSGSVKPNEPCEVLVIGAGAAGGALTWRLAQGGLKVVCLEQGGWIDWEKDAPTSGPDWEVIRETSRNPNPNIRRHAWDYPVNDEHTDIKPLMWNGVGGSLVHWGAHFPRFRPSDFKVRTLDGVADDWPLDYYELERYYDLNDTMVGVSGLAGDPGNPPRSPRQTPPISPGRGGSLMARAFDRLDWHWWLPDLALNSEPYGGRGACNNCGPCDLGCPQKARVSTDVTYWPLAIGLGAELRTECRVAEVTVDGQGRATGATYFDPEGRLLHQRAAAVVVCGNGVGTPRLLLLSQSKAHPDGLANSSGLVGKRLMHHPTGFATGVFDELLEDWKGDFAAAIVSQNFYESDASRGFLRGFQMQCVRAAGGPVGTALGQYLAGIPWGDDHHRLFAEQFGRTVSLTVTSEDLPEESNCVTLDPVLKDGHGIPAPRLHYRVGDNTRKMIAWGVERAVEAFEEAGAKRIVTQQLVESAGFHFMGTTRLGDDPADSVLDRWGRAHDCDNLWVAGGSVFVTGAGLNPTSTIMALALRTADDILAKRKTIEVAA